MGRLSLQFSGHTVRPAVSAPSSTTSTVSARSARSASLTNRTKIYGLFTNLLPLFYGDIFSLERGGTRHRVLWENKVTAVAVSGAIPEPGDEISTKLRRNRRIWIYTLLFFIALGIGCGGAGMLLSLESLLGLTVKTLSSVGTLMSTVSIGSLVLAAHSMDRIYEVERAINLKNSRPQ